MSFMREIITIVSENEAVDARDNIARCAEEIRNFQNQIKSYIDDEYIEYLPHLSKNKLYLTEGTRLCDEADILLQNIANETKKDLLSANEDLQSLVEELEEITIGLRTSNKILRIDALFHSLEDAKNNREYLRVMELTTQIKNLLDDPSDTVLPRLDCFAAIQLKFHVESQMSMRNLREQFEGLVQLSERKFQKTKTVTLRITRDENQLHETIVALMASNYDAQPMCKFLMDNIFVPIVQQPVSLQLSEDDPDHVTLTLSYSLVPPTESAGDLRPNYRIVFANIQQTFQCLGYMNIELSPDVCVLGVFADVIKDRFVQLLLDQCLTPSVPSTMDEMNESTLVTDLLDFNQFLCDMLFLNDVRDVELKEFASKVDVLFKNRFCTNIVESAVAIMRHDLHDMLLVGEEVSADKTALDSFSRCMVSKSTTVRGKKVEHVVRLLNTNAFLHSHIHRN